MSVAGLPISYCNQAFERLTGWSREEVVGQNCRFLQGRGTEAELLSSLIMAVRAGAPLSIKITNYRKDGTPFQNGLLLRPVHDTDGAYRYNIGLLSDVTTLEGDAAAVSELEVFHTKLPASFDARLQPASPPPYAATDPLAQWAQFQPATAKMIRLLWATDPDGALRRLMKMPVIMRQPVMSSLGRYLSTPAMREKLPGDEDRLQACVIIDELARMAHTSPQSGDDSLYEAVDAMCRQHLNQTALAAAGHAWGASSLLL